MQEIHIEKLSDDEVAFFELDAFGPQKMARLIFTPVYILCLALVARDSIGVLLQLIPVLLISGLMGLSNIKYLHRFYVQNRARFAQLISEALDFSEQTRGLANYTKTAFSFRHQTRAYKLLRERDDAWSATRWLAKIYMLSYVIPIFGIYFFIMKGYISNPIIRDYLLVYPPLLFLIANNLFWFIGFVFWRIKLKKL